ncbi:hypothetical protein COO60DRAFT_1703432 [Scenedesmus sp. NREL 46B-D3]|nr:hypothetical protein COO60DRAFT_1703432 [Scenedesmus sp. NREL 46B-D3]
MLHHIYQAVRLAAEVLASAEQRQQYDARGLAALGGGQYKLLHDFMARVHAQGAAAVIGEAGGDISTVLGLEFGEAVTGSACTVTTGRWARAQTARQLSELLCACRHIMRHLHSMSYLQPHTKSPQGSGFDAASSSEDCAMCHGQGELCLRVWVQGGQPRMAGQARLHDELCSGEGRLAVRRHVRIRVPAGVVDAQVLRVRGQGHCGRFGGPPGDLLLSSCRWVYSLVGVVRVGDDLHSPLHLQLYQALLGGSVDVKTVRGECSLAVPPGEAAAAAAAAAPAAATAPAALMEHWSGIGQGSVQPGSATSEKTAIAAAAAAAAAATTSTQHGQLLCARNAGVAKPGMNGVEYGHHFFKVAIQVPDGQAAAPAEAALQQLAQLLRPLQDQQQQPSQQQQQQLQPCRTGSSSSSSSSTAHAGGGGCGRSVGWSHSSSSLLSKQAKTQDSSSSSSNMILADSRPRTIEDVQAAVAQHDHVKPNAEGHSWNQPFFCVVAGANLDTTTAAAAAAAPPQPQAAAPSQQLGRRLAQTPAAPAPAANAAATAAAVVPPAPGSRIEDGNYSAGSGINAAAQPSAAARTASVPNPLPKPSSAAIMMGTIRPLNISVNETDQSVWVDAGFARN